MEEKTKKRWAVCFLIVLALTFIDGWFNRMDQQAEKEYLYGQHQ